MPSPLRSAYMLAVLYCVGFFVFWTLVLLKRRRPDASLPRGSGLKGVVSALTTGMLPWRKESATRNPVSYAAGILYHLGSFYSLLVLASPRLILRRDSVSPVLLTAGLAAGLYLLLKRVSSRNLRAMSGWDDYFSNVLVDSMQLSVILALLEKARPALAYSVGCAVLLYVPWGKLKHCYFFFASRILLGRSYGRRGVMI